MNERHESANLPDFGRRGLRPSAGLVAGGVLCLFWLASCSTSDLVAPGDQPGVLAVGFGIPDGIAVLAETEYLFADRNGSLYHYVDGGVERLEGVPTTRMRGVYGGLLDVSLHPRFQENRQVYIAYDDAAEGLAVARFEFRGRRIEGLEVLYRSDEFSIGSRIEWQDDDHFFLSFGIGGDPYPDPGPQDLRFDVGKIHRLRADGGIPPDNPVFAGSTEPTTVWSYGHRNPQGLFYDAPTQRLYSTEHGPLGGDELNRIEAGGDYGWPAFSYGLNYDNTAVSEMTEQEASALSVLPAKYWGPDFRVAPSGLLMVNGAFLFGVLNPQHLLRYDPVSGETEIVMNQVGRVRDIAALPGGLLLVSVDAGSPKSTDVGRILRVTADGELR